jgi:WD40 repeat protein
LLQFTPYVQRFDFGGPIVSVAVSPDGQVIAVASSNEIALFDAELNPITKITEGLGVVQSLAFRQDDAGLLLATGGCVAAGCSESKGLITFWEIANQGATPISQQQVHSFLVKAVAFSPDGKTLVTGSYDQTVILWDISSLTSPVMLGNPIQAHLSFVNGVVFAPDGETIISAGDDRKILVWDIARPSEVALLGSPSQGHNAPISAIAFSPDGTKFASASNDNSVILWDWNANSRALQIHLRLLGHTGFVKSVAFNGDGSILASAGFDNRIILWDTATGEQIGPALTVHTNAVNSIAFGTQESEGRQLTYLISGGDDRTVIRWDLSARQPLNRTAETTTQISQQLEATNGNYNASASGFEVNLESGGQDFLTLDGFDSPVQYVNFDQQHLLTTDQDQLNPPRVTSWNIDPTEWLELACQAVARNLSPEEWEEYIPSDGYQKTCENLP